MFSTVHTHIYKTAAEIKRAQHPNAPSERVPVFVHIYLSGGWRRSKNLRNVEYIRRARRGGVVNLIKERGQATGKDFGPQKQRISKMVVVSSGCCQGDKE